MIIRRLTKNKREKLNRLFEEATGILEGTGYCILPSNIWRNPDPVGIKRRQYLLKAKDFIDGLFFGFPICCVWFYITKWNYKKDNRLEKTSIGYVPCDRCYKKLFR